jgi:ubiquitin-protein ligase
MARYAKRLTKELKDLQTSPPPGIIVEDVSELTRYERTTHKLKTNVQINDSIIMY